MDHTVLESFLQILFDQGVAVAAVVYFLWRDYVRERSTTQVLVDREQFIRDTLVNLVSETNTNMVGVKELLSRCQDMRRGLEKLDG